MVLGQQVVLDQPGLLDKKAKKVRQVVLAQQALQVVLDLQVLKAKKVK